jgi:hypothetical protein
MQQRSIVQMPQVSRVASGSEELVALGVTLASEDEFRFHCWQDADPTFDTGKASERKLQLEARLRPLLRHAQWLKFARQEVHTESFKNLNAKLHMSGEGYGTATD